jgi:1,4-alpha-glucan branching enzyme
MPELDPYQALPDVRIEHPEWSRNATIYQINTRQFTLEGTFRAAEEHLPRLKALGAVILWLMPVQQIGEKNRKGTLGSPYAVKDYYSQCHVVKPCWRTSRPADAGRWARGGPARY